MEKETFMWKFVIGIISLVMIFIPETLSISIARQPASPAARLVTAREGSDLRIPAGKGRPKVTPTSDMSTAEIVGISAAVVAMER